MKPKKEKKWWQYLLVIPMMLVIDVLALVLTGMADSAVAGEGLGHPVPVFFAVATLICGALTVVLTLRALILCIRAIIRSRRGTPVSAPSPEPRRKKAVWHCFIPLLIELPLALIVVIVSGWIEISSFYQNSMHIGFAFPIATFMLAGLCLLITFVIGIICIIWAAVRSSRNNRP